MVAYSLVFFFVVLPMASADSKCKKSFDCGELGSLEFPLSESPDCGLLQLVDCNSSHPSIHFDWRGPLLLQQKISANKFRVLDSEFENLVKQESCLSFISRSPTNSAFASFEIHPFITMLSCNKKQSPIVSPDALHAIFLESKGYDCTDVFVYYGTSDDKKEGNTTIPYGCSIFHLPVKSNYKTTDLVFQLLSPEFELEWNVSAECLSCHDSGGKCLADSNKRFQCEGGKSKRKTTVALALALSAGAIILTGSFICFFLAIRKKYTPHTLLGLRKQMAGAEYAIELFLKNNGSLAPRRFKYSDLRRMTKAFSNKLGKGGFGTVYKGTLPDGLMVAVKILSGATKTGEEFMNEVASISRTNHVNIVTLLGFCLNGSKRALIYEFMPNGSLEKFILNSTTSPSVASKLGYGKLFNIALGTARGLEYLHQGCNVRIVHFDIKPHNILLDKDFNPKISDFGLAQLCPNRASVLSMPVARGTIGYVAPEVFYRHFGGVSHKSDVYSYGMMILEMAIGKHNLDNQAATSSETYFPDWIYKRLQVGCRVGFLDIMNDDDWELAKKMVIIGLWCIQTLPKNRPSINIVVEMLLGSIDNLEIPPEPYLASPLTLAFDAPSTSGIATDQQSSSLPCLGN